MARITVAGHSLHAILNDWPIGLFSTSLGFDTLGAITGKRRFTQAGYYMLAAGYITGWAAGLTGIAEYRAVERKGDVKKLADRHAFVNGALMTLMSAALLIRARKGGRLTPFPYLLSLGANALTVLSAWYGDELVYGHHVRVVDKKLKKDDRDYRLPMDHEITRKLRGGTVPEYEAQKCEVS